MMKGKMSIRRGAFYAAMMFVTAVAVSCSQHDFNNPLDPANGGDGNPGGNPGGGGQFTLTVNRNPAAGGSVTMTPAGGTYARGTSVNVCASAASGYTFSGWSTGASSTCISVTMNQNQSITANFQAQNANAVIIVLRSWQTQVTDALGDRNLDPRIYFIVRTSVGTTETGHLLNSDNVGQSWSGSSRSGAVSIPMSSGTMTIEAVVLESDPLFNDNISPSNRLSVSLPQTVNTTLTGQSLGSSTTSQSRVTFDLEFVRR